MKHHDKAVESRQFPRLIRSRAALEIEASSTKQQLPRFDTEAWTLARFGHPSSPSEVGSTERKWRFWPDLWAYFGPALMVSVAYIDPGNYGTDISGGASFGYSMLWVVWLAGVMAMLLQYLSGKLGIATGQSLPELIRVHLKKPIYIVPYWLASELAVVMTDLAEFLGTVIALNLLFGIPLIYGTFISVLDVVLIFGVTGGRIRRLEYLFMLFVSIIGIGYVHEIFITGPALLPMLTGSIIPDLSSTSRIYHRRRSDRSDSHASCHLRSFRACERQNN